MRASALLVATDGVNGVHVKGDEVSESQEGLVNPPTSGTCAVSGQEEGSRSKCALAGVRGKDDVDAVEVRLDESPLILQKLSGCSGRKEGGNGLNQSTDTQCGSK